MRPNCICGLLYFELSGIYAISVALIGSLPMSVERVISYIVTKTTGSERKTVIGRKVIISCFDEIKVLN
jgi:hypothetical protein